MKRADLEKLRRLDPKLAAQLEGLMAQQEAAGSGTADEGEVLPSPSGSTGGVESNADAPEVFTPPPKGHSSGGAERACEGPSGAVSSTSGSETDPTTVSNFADADSQLGLPEVPQVLVSTEPSPDEKLAEFWSGYEDDAVPAEELRRRKAERHAEREARMAQYRANARQLGCLPWAQWRRHGTGEHVSCAQLELQLDGIERRVGRASTWDEGLSATRTMEHVEAQCFTVRDLGDRFDNMPGCLRGTFPELTRTQLSLLRAVVTAYMGGAMGIYEYQPILASDLGMSERAMRYALNGGTGRPPGLVELGLVAKRQTWKRGSGERPSDHHYLLLQAGPVLAEVLLPLACEGRIRRGERLPRHCGYTRTSARQAARSARQGARRSRFELAEKAVERSRCVARDARREPPRERRQRVEKRAQITRLNCPAQNADNPVPPPTGVGGLRARRGRPPSPPRTNVSLHDKSQAQASPSSPPSSAGDSSTPKNSPLRDRAQALDEAAQPAPNLEHWRQQKKRGAPVPDEIDALLLREQFSALGGVIWG